MQPITYQDLSPSYPTFSQESQDNAIKEHIVELLNDDKNTEALQLIAANPEVLLDKELIDVWKHVLSFSLTILPKEIKTLFAEISLRILTIYHEEFSLEHENMRKIVPYLLHSLSSSVIQENPPLQEALVSWIACYNLDFPLSPSGLCSTRSAIAFLFTKFPEGIQARLKEKYGLRLIDSHLELEKTLHDLKHKKCLLLQKNQCAQVAREKWNELFSMPFPDSEDASIQNKIRQLLSKLEYYIKESDPTKESPVVFSIRVSLIITSWNKELIELALSNPLFYKALPWIFSGQSPRSYHRDVVGLALSRFLLDKCPAFFTPPWKDMGETPKKVSPPLDSAIDICGPPTEVKSNAELLLSTIHWVQNSMQLSCLLSEEDKIDVQSVLDGLSVSIASLFHMEAALALQDKGSFPLLFPVGIIIREPENTLEGHGLLVEIQDSHLLLYNTGYGLDEKYEKDGLYQTYVKAEFPKEKRKELLFEWRLCSEVSKCGSLEEIRAKFEASGVVEPPSSDPINYEQMQTRGSCSAQCLMAFIRNRIISSISGSPEHKLGVYKAIKAELFSALIRVYGGCFDISPMDELKPHIERKQKELEYEKQLLEQCASLEVFQSMMDTLKSQIHPESDIHSPYARYLLVHKALRAFIYRNNRPFSELEGPGKVYLQDLAHLLEEEKGQAIAKQVAWYETASIKERKEAQEYCSGSFSCFWWADTIRHLA